MSRIGVGIPCFSGYATETANDYMRMWFTFGRRYLEHDFFFIPKTKSEQFRARNSIVDSALKLGLDYLLFIDDDHIFNWEETPEHTPYLFLKKLLDAKKDIVGGLYYHRTGEYKPVLMKEFEPGKYTFYDDIEITPMSGLKQVDVQGGGLMLIDMKVFRELNKPYFIPEQQEEGKSYGTDIQLCRNAKEKGFEVWCHTDVVVGHLKDRKEVVTHLNRTSFVADNMLRMGVADEWVRDNLTSEIWSDMREYSGLTDDQIVKRAKAYNNTHFKRFNDYEDPAEYYKTLGIDQACRQIWFHSRPSTAQKDIILLKQFRKGFSVQGLDFGCGCAPLGFKLLQLGHRIHFVDIDGAGGIEFLKWRIKKYDLESRVGWKIQGPYDFVLMMDIIEHLKDWEPVLDNIFGRIKEGGAVITNFFRNMDFDNSEHINMDHKSVMKFFYSRKLIPRTEHIWFKDDNYMGGAMNINTERTDK